ncbi:FxsA family membrane protein [Streptomyces sp. YIM 98790]|uniref:FxsA family membrane protein n=1 Tax=Streptomyces sp. YIM 98790 TaxID=2689077 RepID=UPI00140956F6|nr:FxsA family membrane protein [Streptomyces sp. YIM 98790]
MTTGDSRSFPPSPGRAGRPGGRLRTLLPLGVALWALAELWLLILLGDAAGGLTVFLVLLAGLVLGALVIRQAGSRAWRRLAESLQRGGAEPEGDGGRGGNALTMLGGLLLMLPGLLSDAVGLLCVFPPTAALLRRTGARLLRSGKGPLGTAYRQLKDAEEAARRQRADGPGAPGGRGGRVVRGEVIRDEPGGPEHGAGGPEDEGRGPRGELEDGPGR